MVSETAALEKHWHLGLANLTQQGEVLGVAGANLHDVDALVEEELDVARVRDLGHDGHVELCGRRLNEKVEALLADAPDRSTGWYGACRRRRGAWLLRRP